MTIPQRLFPEISWRLLGALYLTTLASAALEKFSGPGTPQWFIDQFSPTYLASLPGGLPLSFYLIATLEALAALPLLIAIVSPRPIRSHAALSWGLIIAEALFIALAYGQRLTHKYGSAATLFFYAFLTFVALHLLHGRTRSEPALDTAS